MERFPLDGLRVLDLTRLLPGAFATLMLSELAFAVLVFGRPLAEQFNSYATGGAEFGFVAQVIFAVFPVIQVWRR